MIKQLGIQGMVFFTFSAAGLHWPELQKLISHKESSLTDQETNKHRRQDLIKNPHIATWFFEKWFKLFLEKVLVLK